MILFVYSTNIKASCPNICENFNKPVQSHGPGGGDDIKIDCSSQINGGGNLFESVKFSQACSTVCDGGSCSATGTPKTNANDITFIQSPGTINQTIQSSITYLGQSDGITDYHDIKIDPGYIMSTWDQGPNTVYKFHQLEVKDNATLMLVSGEYWIEDFKLRKGSKLLVSGTGNVRLYYNRITIEDDVQINEISKTNQLVIYGMDNFQTGQRGLINGVFYSKKDIRIDNDTVVNGSLLGKQIELKATSVVNYDDYLVAGTQYDGICTATTPLVSPESLDLVTNSYGINCVTQNIDASVMGCDSNVFTTYNKTITLDTGTGKGTWSLISGNGSLTDSTLNDGLAEYTFSTLDNGFASFGLSYEEGSNSVNLLLQQNDDSSINGTSSIAFSPSNFVITSYLPPNPATGPVNSYSNNQTAGISDTLYLTAYGQSTSSPTCGVIETYNGVKQIKFWQDYINPISGTLTSTIDGTAIASSEGSASNQNVTFNQGQASINVKYRDVGQIKINAKDDFLPVPVGGITGSTNNYVVKPAKFVITVPSNPSASDQNGSVFTQAGENFTVNVVVQDNDGNTTPNYGNETSPQGIRVYSSTLVSPSGGKNGVANDGVLANNTSFSKTSPGNFSATTIQFDEVGIIKLTAGVAGSDYLGAGDITGPESSNVGRFTPYSLSVSTNTPIMESGCVASGFTYLDQAFLYNTPPIVTVSALNKNNIVTENYQGIYWKLLNSSINPTYSSNSSTAPFYSTDAVSDLTFVDNSNGTGTYTFGDGGGFSFNRVSATNISSFDAEIQLDLTFTDQDGISIASNPLTFGGTGTGLGIMFNGGKTFHHGRMVIGNAMGSELTTLEVPIAIEYFNGTTFTPNLSDNCSSFNASNLNLTPVPGSLSTTPSVSTILNGVGQINLTNPGASGYVDVEADLSAANLPFLQYDWAYDGSVSGVLNNNPRGRGTFGISSGESTDIIYLKEIY